MGCFTFPTAPSPVTTHYTHLVSSNTSLRRGRDGQTFSDCVAGAAILRFNFHHTYFKTDEDGMHATAMRKPLQWQGLLSSSFAARAKPQARVSSIERGSIRLSVPLTTNF
jgi:hypothetical protein